MNAAGPEIVLGIAVVFARVGGLFLIAPGLSSLRVPVQLRLFLALGLALSVAPLVYPGAMAAVRGAAPATLVAVLASETLVGVLVGLLSRLVFLALQTFSVAISNFVGLHGVPGASVIGEEGGGAVPNLLMVTALTAIFLTDLHYEMLRGVIGSYAVIAPGAGLDGQAALVAVTDRLSAVFLVGLRLAAPFILYSVVVNFSVGLINKLTPQLPVFFVALPLVTAGGVLMMALTVRELIIAFLDVFAQLAAGL